MESGQPAGMHPAEGTAVRPRLDWGRAGDGGGGGRGLDGLGEPLKASHEKEAAGT